VFIILTTIVQWHRDSKIKNKLTKKIRVPVSVKSNNSKHLREKLHNHVLHQQNNTLSTLTPITKHRPLTRKYLAALSDTGSCACGIKLKIVKNIKIDHKIR
jgi:hypothetical protein